MTPTLPKPRILVALSADALDDPQGWSDIETLGAGAVAVVGAHPSLVPTVERLVAAGISALGHVSLGYATRPPTDVISEINSWAVVPVVGVFLDHAPAGPYQIGPVAHAVRAARRAGLREVVLNPGAAVDPLYRSLDVTICSFEGGWTDYLAWSADDIAAGDGHLVYGVPPQEWGLARTLAATRRAGLLLLTDGPSARFGAARTAAAAAR